MASYDLAVSGDVTLLNNSVQTLYNRPSLRAKLFTGSTTQQIMGANTTVSWNVLVPPVFSFEAPSDQVWTASVDANGAAPARVPNAFTVAFPQVQVSQQAPKTSLQQAVTSVTAICVLQTSGGSAGPKTIAAMANLTGASEIDRAIYTQIIIPQSINTANAMLSGLVLPQITFHNLSFGTPAFAIGSGRCVMVANLAGSSAPAAPAPDSVPAGPLVVLLSPAAMQQIVNIAAAGLPGQSANTSGSQNFGLGSASYSASIQVNSISATVDPQNPRSINANVSLQASANAGITILGGVVGDIVHGIETAAEAVASGVSSVISDIGHALSGY